VSNLLAIYSSFRWVSLISEEVQDLVSTATKYVHVIQLINVETIGSNLLLTESMFPAILY